MSDQRSRGMFALAILGGVFWVLQSLLPQIAALIGGVELVSGFLLILVFGYGSKLVVAVLSFSVLWSVFRDPRSFRQSDLATRIATIAGALFLVTTPFASGDFYYLVPQPESVRIQFALFVVWNVSVAVLVGCILVKSVNYNFISIESSG